MTDEKSGCKTNIFPVTIGTDAGEIVKENPKRTCLIVYNNSASTIYLLSAQNQKTTDGLPILKGETYTNTYSKAAFWAISASTGLDIRVEEDSD
jgi:hypothetical protein